LQEEGANFASENNKNDIWHTNIIITKKKAAKAR